ncbi:adenylate/guanylate cyclase domain-containing protein [Gorillibacterium sp. sgz5001074]|uniref:adenylate/guanylate cyclase domain-containing protein n=1 Tax=Gorillibacterium sp. sgz5001074 TaxID=3446695 RepID=UPI003F67EE09
MKATYPIRERVRRGSLYGLLLPGGACVLLILGFSPSLGTVAACIGLMAVLYTYVRRLDRLLRIRIEEPMLHFRSNLEDMSEGFIMDTLSEEEFAEAEPAIAEAAREVLRINRMMLHNVDSLEKGFEEERLAKLRQAELTRAYERFVPKEFLSFLRKRSITEVRLGDHVETRMTVMFVDIRSFTTLSEQIQPEANFHFLNDYFAEMEPVIQSHGGFIDKYIGDGIMALFHQDTDAALDAAIGMMERLEGFNRSRLSRGLAPIKTGIGLNTGRLMLGIVGGPNRMEGTVISDVVNVASRLEDLNKLYGTSILISEDTYRTLQKPEDYGIRWIDRIRVKGKTRSVNLFEVYQADSPELRKVKAASRVAFEEAVRLYADGNTAEAGLRFSRLSLEHPEDLPARRNLEACQAAGSIEAAAGCGAASHNQPKEGGGSDDD